VQFEQFTREYQDAQDAASKEAIAKLEQALQNEYQALFDREKRSMTEALKAQATQRVREIKQELEAEAGALGESRVKVRAISLRHDCSCCHCR
jgi:hypothetical protein